MAEQVFLPGSSIPVNKMDKCLSEPPGYVDNVQKKEVRTINLT